MKLRESPTKPSEPDKVDAYLKDLKHPLAGVAKALREIILKTDPEIGEEIKWNAPAFFYSGELPPVKPKEYKGTSLYSTSTSRTVFGWCSQADPG